MSGYCFAIIISYLIGSSNMALYIAKARKVNLRSAGSGNLGASNATILLGWKMGILVALHDISKAVAAVFLARYLFPDLLFVGSCAGVACVLGHIFPFYLKFKGGKGFASYIGMLLALNWKFALVIMAAVVLVTLITDYIVAGTTLTIVASPLWAGFQHHSLIPPAILMVASLVILYKHRENYVRICKGTEVGLRSTAKGKHRIG